MKREPRYIDASRIDMNQQTIYDYEAGKWTLISNIPTADVAPIVHAHLTYKPAYKDALFGFYTCSACGTPFWTDSMKYCSECGAKFDEET